MLVTLAYSTPDSVVTYTGESRGEKKSSDALIRTALLGEDIGGLAY